MAKSSPSQIIAEILKEKKVIFIIGNGFAPVPSIINDDDFLDVCKQKHGKTKVAGWDREDLDRERWNYLEHARFVTNNTTPSLAYFVLNYLIDKKHIKSLITTNYDLYLNSVFERTNKLHDSYCFNPAIKNGDFDWEDYYSPRTPSNPDKLKIFKVHGSLSHVVFRNCLQDNNQLHIFKLPSFIIGFDTREIRKMWEMNYLHNYLGHIGIRHNQPTLINDEKQTGYYVHYIDWAVKSIRNNSLIYYRDFFAKEIECAKKELKKISDIGAVIVIGFTGYFNQLNLKDEKNEELSPAIVSLLNKVPVFYFLHQRQYDMAVKDKKNRNEKLYLWNAVSKVNDKYAVKYKNPGKLMLDLACGQKQRLKERLYAIYLSDWVNSNLFKAPQTL